jgi:hypothetical protein
MREDKRESKRTPKRHLETVSLVLWVKKLHIANTPSVMKPGSTRSSSKKLYNDMLFGSTIKLGGIDPPTGSVT